jgi:signal transduction histidine kinase/ActR/RegA family two-component response regulator
MLGPWLGVHSGLILFVPAVMAATWLGGLWPGIAAMVLAAVVGESAVAHPAGIVAAGNHDPVGLVLFILVGLQIVAGTELLHRRTREARAASQAKDNFIRMLSHELRTPLTPALLTASALAADTTLPDNLREQMELIGRNLAMEVRLIDDLLDVSRIQKGKLQLRREVVELERVVREAMATCAQAAAAKHLRLRFHSAGGPYHVNADPARLQQVFWNLLRNAVKFTPDGGTVSINISSTHPSTASVQVSDTGIGIPRERLGGIFRAFEQGGDAVTRQFGGLGLGLSITRALVEMHGGTVDAASEGLGHGATFVVRLPVSAFPVANRPERKPLGARMPTLRILYVEDHADTLQVMTRLLERFGHRVTTADNYRHALATAAEGEPFDMIISDLSLPDGDGLDLFSKLVAAQRVRQGIAVTGCCTDEDVRRSLTAGFCRHLTKPLDIGELQRTLEEISGQTRAGPARAGGWEAGDTDVRPLTQAV